MREENQEREHGVLKAGGKYESRGQCCRKSKRWELRTASHWNASLRAGNSCLLSSQLSTVPSKALPLQ